MPFTPSHIAAVLPFRRTRLVWSALVVGAIAPDLEYFLRMSPQGRYGHTLPGLFLFTLPLGILTLWLFHTYVKTPFVELLPEGLERRLVPSIGKFRFGSASRFALIVISLLVGVCTHLIWDSFTHGNTWTTDHMHVLSYPVALFHIGMVPLYKVLQHASTVLGLAALFVWLVAWYQAGKDGFKVAPRIKDRAHHVWPRRKILALAAIATVAALGGVFRAWSENGIPSNHSALARFIAAFAATMIALMWWQFVAIGIWRSRRRTK
jgi:hypothetical protein